MRRLTLALVMLVSAASVRAKDDGFDTFYEKSGYKATPRYEETVAYCERLADASRWLHYTTFGTSPQGRGLPLLIADKDRGFSPDRAHGRGKVVVLVQAGIHAGEIDGKDAGLMLLRDIAVRKVYPELLDHVTILFIPIYNVDGHERFSRFNRINQNGPEEMGYRVTAQRLNLNRDYLKADAPETRAWLALFNQWQPDFFIDCHVTDGTDHQYVLTYIMDIFGNMDPDLTAWTRDTYLAPVKERMAEMGYEMFPYVMLLQWPNPRSGIASWVSTPRFSTGYTSLRNRPGLLIETHALKDYRTRVTATYELLRETVVRLGEEHESLVRVTRAADTTTASESFRRDPYPLRFRPDSTWTMIPFKGVAYTEEPSDISGSIWYRFGTEPDNFDILYLDQQVVLAGTMLPAAYVIPQEWTEVIDRLASHGLQLKRLRETISVEVETYRFEGLDWVTRPYEGRHPVSFETRPVRETRTYAAGSVVVEMGQPLARVAAHILEPEGPDSYLRWGFFDAVFEQKEYGEGYVLEKLAREMLERDPALAESLQIRRRDDPEFAANPSAILNWFYKQSPYWDNDIGAYPVGKVMTQEALKKLDAE